MIPSTSLHLWKKLRKLLLSGNDLKFVLFHEQKKVSTTC